MRKFNNILFVTRGFTDDREALTQALTLAHTHQGSLKALIVCPQLPEEMTPYENAYKKALIEPLKKTIQSCCKRIGISENAIPITIDVESGPTPAIKIVRHVLKNNYDLLIKEADGVEDDSGFKALDMDLLRLCPCPVFLSRPFTKSQNAMKIAVAIDPEDHGPEAYDLSLKLLQWARFFAHTHSSDLHVISCWDYEFEEYLRNNVWIKMEEHQLVEEVIKAKETLLTRLQELLQKAEIRENIKISHIRGNPSQIIPQYVIDEDISLLVMGTIARTGISGFIIGNTAENILQKISCPLLALKPDGFVSSVKAY